MNSVYGNSLATKGIAGGGVLPTKGYLILSVKTRKFGGAYTDPETIALQQRLKEEKKKIIEVQYIYDSVEYIEKKEVDENIEVNMSNVHLEIIDNKPKIIFDYVEY